MIQTSEGNLPQGLDAAIRTGLERGRRTVARRARVRRGAVRSALCLALVLGLFAGGVNASPAFAARPPSTASSATSSDTRMARKIGSSPSSCPFPESAVPIPRLKPRMRCPGISRTPSSALAVAPWVTVSERTSPVFGFMAT